MPELTEEQKRRIAMAISQAWGPHFGPPPRSSGPQNIDDLHAIVGRHLTEAGTRQPGESAAAYLARIQAAGEEYSGLQGVSSQDRAAMQQRLDRLSLGAQQAVEQERIAGQARQESDLREKTRQDILARIPGLQTELGNSLLNQEQQALSVERPLIDASLNARGLLNSGALAEAYARAQKDLESQRQARLSDFAIGARANAELGMPQEAANQAIELQRAGLQRGFGLSDAYREQGFQQNLNSEALREAAMERQRRRRAALGAGVGGGLGAGLGGYLGGPYGAGIGYGIGSGIGGSFGI